MNEERFAIITEVTTHVEGDQRSKDWPGHGYPAHSYSQQVFKEYDNREKWEAAIKGLASPTFGYPQKFTAIIFREAEISTTVNVDIH